MDTTVTQDRTDRVALIEQLDERLRWLSSWMIHNANNIREKRDGLKVGGHQASCSSVTAIMAALYFHGCCQTNCNSSPVGGGMARSH